MYVAATAEANVADGSGNGCKRAGGRVSGSGEFFAVSAAFASSFRFRFRQSGWRVTAAGHSRIVSGKGGHSRGDSGNGSHSRVGSGKGGRGGGG